MRKWIQKILFVLLMLSILTFCILSLFNFVFAITLLIKEGNMKMIIWNVISFFLIGCFYFGLIKIEELN